MSSNEHSILLFGPAATTAGAGSVSVSCPPGSTCDDVRQALIDQHAALAAIAKAGRLAVNGAYVEGTTVINGSDEIALVALVSGG